MVFSLSHFTNGRQNCIFHAKKNICNKKNILTKLFLSFSDYEGYFLRLPLRYLMLGCQKYSLRVQRITLRKVMFFWDFFKIVFGLWAIIVQTFGEKFQQSCPNCILRVQRTCRFFCKTLSCFIWLRLRATKNLSSEKKSFVSFVKIAF